MIFPVCWQSTILNTGSFEQTYAIHSGMRKDVLTLLIHPGYLEDLTEHCVYIPNNEIRNGMQMLFVSDWGEASKLVPGRCPECNLESEYRWLHRNPKSTLLRPRIFSIMMKCIKLYHFTGSVCG